MSPQALAFFIGARSWLKGPMEGVVIISWSTMSQQEFAYMAKSLGVHL